tara:strand:+ start:1156 stop:2715 length:1560 start_codon:yes stop_codon:yes gene_type:complete
MAEQKLNIKVSTTGAKKSKDELSGLNGAINKMGKAVGVASAAYFGAKGLISAFSTVIEASARQEQAEKALEVALGKTSRALLNQASSLQQVTTAGDEAIIEQQAFLASLKFTEDQIKTIIPVALDLSAATGISLESAVRNTSKTFSGLAGELGELVPQLRELTQEEMKAGKAVEVLGDLFEGQAAKQSDTLAGSLTQMSNAVGDAAEAIGSLLSPMVISTANAIKTLAEGVGSVVERFQDFGKEVDGVLIDEKTTEIEKFTESIKGLSSEELLELNKQLGRTEGSLSLVTDQTNLLTEKNKILIETYTKIVEAQQAQKEKIEELGGTIEITNELRRSDLDMDLKKVANFEIIKKDMRDQINLANNLSSSLQTAFDPDLGAGEAFKGFIVQLMSTMQGVILGSKAMSEALSFAFVPGVGVGASVAALLALEAAKAGVRNIKFAETGFDGVVNSPTMFMTGESGAERVQVTPLQGPNINGPQGGGGIIVNIQGGIIDESYVSNELIPAINKATSLGTKLNA